MASFAGTLAGGLMDRIDGNPAMNYEIPSPKEKAQRKGQEKKPGKKV
jgi:hypothetical protein